MKKKGFTLVELIAAIAIIAIIAIITAPNILKMYKQSRIDAMIIQENKLVESGDILVEDYCKNPINDEKLSQCDTYYRQLDKDETSSENIITKYICVKDLKELGYYSEELKYSGKKCQGVVIFEEDEETGLEVKSYSYVECGEKYTSEIDREIDKTLFEDCFDEITEGEQGGTSEEEKEYTLTVRFTESSLNGPQITHDITEKLEKGEEYTIEVPSYTANGNVYEYFIHSTTPKKEKDNLKIENESKIKVTMPSSDLTINLVYSISKFNLTTNYYYFIPSPNHMDIYKDTNKVFESETINAFTNETIRVNKKQKNDYKILVCKKDSKNECQKVDDYTDHTNVDYDIKMGVQDIVVNLIYQKQTFNITYNNNGGTGCTTGTTTYNKNYENLCTPTRRGYIFKGWNDENNSLITNNTKNEYYSDITLTAKWEPIKYTVKYSCNGGTGTVSTQTVNYDSNITIATSGCTKTGYTFKGFSTKNNTNDGYGWTGWSGKWVYINGEYGITNDTLQLYAIWQANSYTIEYSLNGGTKGTSAPTSGTYDTSVLISNPLKTVKVTGNTNSTSGANGTGVTIGSATSKAQTFAGWTSSTSAGLSPSTAKIGTTTNPTTSWNGSATKNTYFKNLRTGSGTVTLTANWTPVSFSLPTVTKTGYKCGWNASSNGKTITYNSGASYTPSATSAANINMYSVCTPNTYTVVYDCNGASGTTASSKHTYDVAKTLTANGCTKPGYSFNGWKDSNGNTYTNKQSVKNLTANNNGVVTLTAQWTVCSYSIAFASNGGTGSMSNMTLKYNEEKTLTANAFTKSGYTYKNWKGSNGTTYANKAAVTMLTTTCGGTFTMTAQWNPNTYTITYNCNGGSGSTASSAHTYDVAKALTANGCSKQGSVFNGWNTASDGSGTSYSNQKSVTNLTTTNSKTITLYAQWKVNEFPLELDGNGATTAGTTTVTATYNRSLPSITIPQRKYTVTFNANGGSVSSSSLTASYVFNGYYYNGTQYYNSSGTSVTVWNINSSATLTASWTNKSVTLPSPTRDGYEFKGWYTASSGGTKIGAAGASYTPTSAITLYAQWTEKVYQVLNASGTHVSYQNSLANAISAASSGYTIKALKNNTSSAVTVNKNLTLNTNGYTITMTGSLSNSASLTINGGGVIKSSINAQTIKNTKTLTLSNVSVNNSSNVALYNSSGATITIPTQYTGTSTGDTACHLYIESSSSYAIQNAGTMTIGYDSKNDEYDKKTTHACIISKNTYAIHNSGTLTYKTGARSYSGSTSTKAIYNTGTFNLQGGRIYYNNTSASAFNSSGTINKAGSWSPNSINGTIQTSYTSASYKMFSYRSDAISVTTANCSLNYGYNYRNDASNGYNANGWAGNSSSSHYQVGTTSSRYLAYYTIFTTPSYSASDDESSSVSFTFWTTNQGVSSINLNYAITTEYSNGRKLYANKNSAVTDPNQITAGTITWTGINSSKVYKTLTINTNGLKPNTTYYLWLWPNASLSTGFIVIQAEQYSTCKVNYK